MATDDALILAAVADYKKYVAAKTADTVAKTTVFTDAVRAGDLTAAKAAFAPARESAGSRSSRSPGLVSDIDGAVDARVDDFAGVNDPDVHRLAQARVPALGEATPPTARRPSPTSSTPTSRPSRPTSATSTSRRSHGTRRLPSSSRRSPRARSRARKTATRTPTCGTSRPTSRGREGRRAADAGAREGGPRPACARSTGFARDRRRAREVRERRRLPVVQQALTTADTDDAEGYARPALSEELAEVPGALGLRK